MALVTEANPLDQTMTFGPSRKDVLGQYQFYFGDPAQPEKLNLYTEQHALTPHLPDAYAGRSVQLIETINNLVRDTLDNWYTNNMLPFKRMDDSLNVEWNELSFDRRLMQRVPYEGTSRMLTSLKRSHRDRMVRHGLAMMIESDFFRTREGREHFINQIKQIRDCVILTCNHEVMWTLLTCHNCKRRYNRTPFPVPLPCQNSGMSKAVAALVRRVMGKVKSKARARDRARQWNRDNPGRVAKRCKEYYGKNKQKIITKATAWNRDNKVARNLRMRTWASSYLKHRRETDPVFVHMTRLRNQMHSELRKVGTDKQHDQSNLLGCTPAELINHLTQDVPADTSLAGYEIDHIFPMCRYDLSREDVKCMHYSNLQLLTKKDNQDKGVQLPNAKQAARVPHWPDRVAASDIPEF